MTGVVDTEDLPLNVSREMLQATPVLARIRKAVTNRVISELKTRAKDEADFDKFWDNFGPTFKEGIWMMPSTVRNWPQSLVSAPARRKAGPRWMRIWSAGSPSRKLFTT